MGKIKNFWCLPFLVLISMACSTLFHDFLEKYIWIVLITNFILSSISAYKLIMFQNKMDQFYFFKLQQTARDILSYFIVLKSITVIEHDNRFYGDASHYRRCTRSQMFWYTNKNNKIVSHKISIIISKCRFKKVFEQFNFIDNLRHNIYYIIV